jgi:cell division protein FtsB
MGKKKKPFLKTIIPVVLNKYFLSIIAMVIWVVFFDKNDLFSQYQLRQKLQQLRVERNYYNAEIAKSKNDMNELRTNPENLEKFAREKYQMKKDNEEIFVIVKDSTGTKSAGLSAP